MRTLACVQTPPLPSRHPPLRIPQEKPLLQFFLRTGEEGLYTGYQSCGLS